MLGREKNLKDDHQWEPLVVYRRNGVIENTVHGSVSWWSGGREIHSLGSDVLCYGRSTMKPLYLKPFTQDLADCTNWKQKAISLASHNGAREHVEVAKSLLNKTDQGLMLTPVDLPLVPSNSAGVTTPDRWLNNSSGHHAAILRGCLLRGWDRGDYMSPRHGVFKNYVNVMKSYLGEDWQPLSVARDGDGLPTVSMTMGELSRCYAGLAQRRGEDWIWEAMVREPHFIGGEGRLDTAIIGSCGGSVIAKEGADGLLALAIEHLDHPEGLGVAVKVAHGWDPQATWYVARGILGSLGFELPHCRPLKRQRAFVSSEVVPTALQSCFQEISMWDNWDLESDRWDFEIEI